MKLNNKKMESGMGLLEAIVAIGVFTIVMAAVVLMYINVTVGSLLALEKTKAIFLAQEGLEATRSIGFHNFYNLVPDVHGLGILANRWQLIGNSDLTDGRFTRTITITSPDPVSHGLVGHWTFNDKRGCALRDISGEKNHGFLRPTCPANSPTWGLDRHNRVNRALNFDGVNDFVEVPDSPNLRLGKNMTVKVWIKPLTNVGDWARLVGKGVSGPRNFGLWRATDGDILWQIRGGGLWGNCWNNLGAGDPLNAPVGMWMHVVGIYDGTNMRIYSNGVLRRTCPFNQYPDTSADPVTIGFAGFHTHFNGLIDEVRIYNRALTVEEIRTLYNHGRQRIENRLEENIESRLIESRVEWNSPLLGAREVRLKKEITRQ